MTETAAPARRPRMRPPEAASYTGVAESTLAKLRVTGGGPSYSKVGRLVLYDVGDLDAWLDARRVRSTSEPAAAA